MASEHATATKIEVEKDRVPKLTTHFESLADKTSSTTQLPRSENHEKEVTTAATREAQTETGAEGRQGLSLEDISDLRGKAQHNSIEAIRAAEERYEKAKQEAEKETQPIGHTHDGGEKEKETLADTARSAKEGGKGAVAYAGEAATGVKDQAVVAGWGATQYTMEKVAQATKAVVGVTSHVAGYTKDKVAGAGQTVAGYAGEKLVAAKDAVVANEEKATDYAARKKAEARRDLEAKKSSQERGNGSKTEPSTEKEMRWKDESPLFEEKKTSREEEESEEKGRQVGSGSVFEAIGETLAEIGEITKDLIAGGPRGGGI